MLDNELELTIQACQILDGENEKLKARIVELEGSLLAHKRGWQASVERNKELKVQVEQLREAILKIGKANTLCAAENLLAFAERLALPTHQINTGE